MSRNALPSSTRLKKKGVAASAPSRILSSLSWLAARTGTHEIRTPAIEAKVARVKHVLTTVLTATPKRAETPPREVIAALEHACFDSTNPVVVYAAGIFRILCGASSRFDDGQHSLAKLLVNLKRTLEVRAWQTKTIDAGETARIYPITCVKYAYTGKPWYDRFWELHQQLQADPNLTDRGYLLPRPTSGYAGFVARPCPRDTALTMYRDIVRDLGPLFDITEEQIKKLTLPVFC